MAAYYNETAFPEHSDSFAGARRAMVGDYGHLLPRDGVSVGVERSATHGYGNAIVPQVAAEVIGAYLDMEAA